MTTTAMTAAEITDARLDVIARARESLKRAVSECRAWRGPYPLRVVAAMAALEGALRAVDEPADEAGKDQAVRLCAHWTGVLVAVTEDVMGREAAVYVAGGMGDEGDEAA